MGEEATETEPGQYIYPGHHQRVHTKGSPFDPPVPFNVPIPTLA